MLNFKSSMLLAVTAVAITLTACNKNDKAQTAPAETQHEQHVASDAEHSTHAQVAHQTEPQPELTDDTAQSAEISAIDQPTAN